MTLLLWALADAMSVHPVQLTIVQGRDSSDGTDPRLPLIRAIWADELGVAANASLGFARSARKPEYGDPGFADWLTDFDAVHTRIEQAVLRGWGLAQDPGAFPADDRLAFHVVTSIRVAAKSSLVAGTRATARTRSGCVMTVVAFLILGSGVVRVVHG